MIIIALLLRLFFGHFFSLGFYQPIWQPPAVTIVTTSQGIRNKQSQKKKSSKVFFLLFALYIKISILLYNQVVPYLFYFFYKKLQVKSAVLNDVIEPQLLNSALLSYMYLVEYTKGLIFSTTKKTRQSLHPLYGGGIYV